MADSIHESILDAVLARVRALDLDGTENRVYEDEVIDDEWARHVNLPCVLVSDTGVLRSLGTSSCKDRWGYPITIKIVDRGPVKDGVKRRQHLKWRKAILNSMHLQRLTTVDGSPTPTYVDTPTIEAPFLLHDLIVRPLVFECEVEESRP